jgi:hypothetical protein
VVRLLRPIVLGQGNLLGRARPIGRRRDLSELRRPDRCSDRAQFVCDRFFPIGCNKMPGRPRAQFGEQETHAKTPLIRRLQKRQLDCFVEHEHRLGIIDTVSLATQASKKDCPYRAADAAAWPRRHTATGRFQECSACRRRGQDCLNACPLHFAICSNNKSQNDLGYCATELNLT